MNKKSLNSVLFYLILLGLASTCFLSCKNDVFSKPDFSISNLTYKDKGVYFDFYNKAQKDIKSMQIKMCVYDKKNGSAAFEGEGIITCQIDSGVLALEQRSFCISLQDYFTDDKDLELIIDNFYISRILYTDGKEWKDWFGLYSQKGE